jgi:hypothetical protein
LNAPVKDKHGKARKPICNFFFFSNPIEKYEKDEVDNDSHKKLRSSKMKQNRGLHVLKKIRFF